MNTTEATPQEQVQAWADEHLATMIVRFIPWSKSRNAEEKNPSLNWKITIQKDGRDVVTTDYSAGSGHCPAYKATVKELGNQNSIIRDRCIREECEHGVKHEWWDGMSRPRPCPKETITLPLSDVLWSLSCDASAIDAGGFSDWCSEYGYDDDSMRAKATYDACIDIALKMRAAFGNAAMEALAEACQDY